jgi:hypothetical protein
LPESYRVSDTYLTTSISVGPSTYGAFLEAGANTTLFLSAPSLPENTIIGPIHYGVLASGTYMLAVLTGSQHPTELELQQNVRVWPFDISPFSIVGLISKGSRIGMVELLGRDAYTYINTTNVTLRYASESIEGQGRSRQPVRDFDSTAAKSIRLVRKRVNLDDDAIEIADRAVEEACEFVNREIPDESPIAMVFDDGTVVLQWRRGDSGALLIFPGDGTVTFSTKRSGGQYTPDGIELSISESLPKLVRTTISSLKIPL